MNKNRNTGKGPGAKAKLTPVEKLKLEILAELGLLEKVEREGWKALTLAECGRVGGILNSR
ncbi:MAG TPA: small, acid-soluble spore protein, alpha/beta type, partial [Syntrophothermus lipocalidus]|nr:small, acid-soluble spore protein, alpha/beta type [Syntrophothermus lipocalidus]